VSFSPSGILGATASVAFGQVDIAALREAALYDMGPVLLADWS